MLSILRDDPKLMIWSANRSFLYPAWPTIRSHCPTRSKRSSDTC